MFSQQGSQHVCVDKPALLQRWRLQHSTRCQLHGSRGRSYGAGLQVRLGVSALEWPQDTFGKEEWGSCDRRMWEYLSTPAFKHPVAVGLEVCGAGSRQQPYVQQSGGCYRETCSSSWGRGLAVYVPKESWEVADMWSERGPFPCVSWVTPCHCRVKLRWK